MSVATHDDIVRVFPGIQDHTVLEILSLKASVAELDAALMLLTSDDKDLTDIKRREGGQIHRLLSILNQAEIRPLDDPDH
jgi:hypothetical protein